MIQPKSRARLHTPRKHENNSASDQAPTKTSRRSFLLWSGVTGSLAIMVAYLSYGLLSDRVGGVDASVHPFTPAGKPIQIDVLNGCGVSGIASKITTYLRKQGFDVVDMRNYRSFDMKETLVIDRVGNLATARQVAGALGVKSANIIQEINPDYFVDVSVVIGKDYPTLRVLRQ